MTDPVQVYPHTKETVTALLLELCTGEGVAANLQTLGVRATVLPGHPRRCSECPIAIYLARRGVEHLNVTNYGLVWFGGRDLRTSTQMPRPVCEFVDAADFGGHPEVELYHD